MQLPPFIYFILLYDQFAKVYCTKSDMRRFNKKGTCSLVEFFNAFIESEYFAKHQIAEFV